MKSNKILNFLGTILKGQKYMEHLEWLKVRKSSWYYPAIFGILSAALAVGLTFFDHQFDDANLPSAIKPFFISVELAVQILNTVVIVSSTILTFTFSTTMVVLTNFSSQYSESLVENFLDNTVTLKAFGIFLGALLIRLPVSYYSI